MRVKAIYLINAPNFIERLLTLIRQIVRPKLVERVCLSEMYRYVIC